MHWTSQARTLSLLDQAAWHSLHCTLRALGSYRPALQALPGLRARLVPRHRGAARAGSSLDLPGLDRLQWPSYEGGPASWQDFTSGQNPEGEASALELEAATGQERSQADPKERLRARNRAATRRHALTCPRRGCVRCACSCAQARACAPGAADGAAAGQGNRMLRRRRRASSGVSPQDSDVHAHQRTQQACVICHPVLQAPSRQCALLTWTSAEHNSAEPATLQGITSPLLPARMCAGSGPGRRRGPGRPRTRWARWRPSCLACSRTMVGAARCPPKTCSMTVLRGRLSDGVSEAC